MIEIAERIEVAATPDRTWRVLADPRQVVACVPGAALDELRDDGTFDGRMTVAFGPLRVPFTGKGRLELDEPNRHGTLSARGADGRGATRFRAEARFEAHAVPDAADRTALTIRATVNLSGRLAGVVESGAGVVVREMSAQFATALSALVAPAAPAPSHDEAAAPVHEETAVGTVAPRRAAPVSAWRIARLWLVALLRDLRRRLSRH
jgi:carbon monoxide dehydrogenase subunit G